MPTSERCRPVGLRGPGHPWEGGSEHPLATAVLPPAQGLAWWPSSVGRSLRTQPGTRSHGPGQGGAPAAQRGRTTLTRLAAEGDWAQCEASGRPLGRARHHTLPPFAPAGRAQPIPNLTSNHTGECRKWVDMFRDASRTPAVGRIPAGCQGGPKSKFPAQSGQAVRAIAAQSAAVPTSPASPATTCGRRQGAAGACSTPSMRSSPRGRRHQESPGSTGIVSGSWCG